MSGPAPSRNHTVDTTRRFSALYFGYASNLSPSVLKGRCPDSLFCGLALLTGYRWHINSTGYGNIVKTDSADDVVYGSLYFLSPRDEAGLDESEGVPWLYQKHELEVERVDSEGKGTGQKVGCVSYVDVERVEDGVIMDDYIVWIRKAVKEGKPLGLPDEWVRKVIRPWISESRWADTEEDERVIEMVRVCQPRGAIPKDGVISLAR